jgi:hypothetical protein
VPRLLCSIGQVAPVSALIQRADDFLRDWDKAWEQAAKGRHTEETERERRYREGVERRTDWIVSRLEQRREK